KAVTGDKWRPTVANDRFWPYFGEFTCTSSQPSGVTVVGEGQHWFVD
ncbi:hypothetical protein PanWU01x14_157680, partial [Parasponia andersonii]